MRDQRGGSGIEPDMAEQREWVETHHGNRPPLLVGHEGEARHRAKFAAAAASE